MPIGGWNYDKDMEVCVPSDVVQWRVEARPEDVVEIHLARGDGFFEIRDLEEGAERYVIGGLRHSERTGSDKVCVFIQEEW